MPTNEWDFLLKIVAKNIKAYYFMEHLSRVRCMRWFNSSVAVIVINGSTALSLGDTSGTSAPVISRIPPPNVRYDQNQFIIVARRLRMPSKNPRCTAPRATKLERPIT
jgi:hypothetical protein